MNRRRFLAAAAAVATVGLAETLPSKHHWKQTWTGNGVRGERDWFAIGIRDDEHQFCFCGLNNSSEEAMAQLNKYLDPTYTVGHVHGYEPIK